MDALGARRELVDGLLSALFALPLAVMAAARTEEITLGTLPICSPPTAALGDELGAAAPEGSGLVIKAAPVGVAGLPSCLMTTGILHLLWQSRWPGQAGHLAHARSERSGEPAGLTGRARVAR